MWELADDGSHGCGKARLSVCNRDPGKEAWLVVPGGEDQAGPGHDGKRSFIAGHTLHDHTPTQQEGQATNEPTLTLDSVNTLGPLFLGRSR